MLLKGYQQLLRWTNFLHGTHACKSINPCQLWIWEHIIFNLFFEGSCKTSTWSVQHTHCVKAGIPYTDPLLDQGKKKSRYTFSTSASSTARMEMDEAPWLSVAVSGLLFTILVSSDLLLYKRTPEGQSSNMFWVRDSWICSLCFFVADSVCARDSLKWDKLQRKSSHWSLTISSVDHLKSQPDWGSAHDASLHTVPTTNEHPVTDTAAGAKALHQRGEENIHKMRLFYRLLKRWWSRKDDQSQSGVLSASLCSLGSHS